MLAKRRQLARVQRVEGALQTASAAHAPDASLDSSVFALVLHRYILGRAECGERVTRDATVVIWRIACIAGLRPASCLASLGFSVENEVVRPLGVETAASLERRLTASEKGSCAISSITEAIRIRSASKLAQGFR